MSGILKKVINEVRWCAKELEDFVHRRLCGCKGEKTIMINGK